MAPSQEYEAMLWGGQHHVALQYLQLDRGNIGARDYSRFPISQITPAAPADAEISGGDGGVA